MLVVGPWSQASYWFSSRALRFRKGRKVSIVNQKRFQ
jgi:hypothetical protein